MASGLPAYAGFLEAYHKAFSAELQRMVAELPLCAGDRALDMGCGDGTYSRWLAPRVMPDGEIVGVDASPAYLRRARRRIGNGGRASGVRFVRGDIRRLPFKDGAFDVAWCAQNLFSFPDPEQAICELTRVVRPGGIVVVFENDSLHHILLPWPVEVELALANAEWRAAVRHLNAKAKKYYVARGLRALFRHAGLKPQRKRIYTSQRETPLTSSENAFLRLYLDGIWRRTRPFLQPAIRRKAAALLRPDSRFYLPRQKDFTLTCLDQVIWGKKPAA